LKQNPHEEDCYQTLTKNELIKHGWRVFDYDLELLFPPEDKNYNECRLIEDKIYKKYCDMFNLSFDYGRAIHCTCGRDKKYEKWLENNGHTSDCELVKPNFLYKPINFQIKWYKYPLRDSYMNQNITYKEFN
jgi:hypothetical protein